MKTLYVQNRTEWRAWLEKHGKSANEIYLIYYKMSSGKPRIAYEDAVAEALRFGWIDGKIRKLDEKRFVQRFTPRSPQSRWSEINIKRARKLIRQGRMMAAGRAVFHPERQTAARPSELPALLQEKFEAQSDAWENFQRFPPFYRRMTIAWVASAKKEETKLKRLKQLIESSARNERIKFM